MRYRKKPVVIEAMQLERLEDEQEEMAKPAPLMPREMRQILADLELLSHGTITNYSPSGRSADGAGAPGGEAHPPHLRWREAWAQASTLQEQQRVYGAAKKELESWTHRQESAVVVGETQEQLEARIVREGEGWTIEQVAQHCRVTPTLVRKARLKAGVDIVNGTPLVTTKTNPSRDERVERAREMRREGRTLRQIAMFLGCDAATVHRDLAA